MSLETMKSVSAITADSDYDPNSMPVAKAREYIRAFLTPVTAVERLHLRAALGRVLAQQIRSGINVPSHDNSAMDGYAVRFADLEPNAESSLKVVGTSFAGKPFHGSVGRREAADHDRWRDAVRLRYRDQQEHVRCGRAPAVPPGQQQGANVRYAGADIKTIRSCSSPARSCARQSWA
jgi:molybdopterin molybdotransferase